jgi:hypothetical protein
MHIGDVTPCCHLLCSADRQKEDEEQPYLVGSVRREEKATTIVGQS